MSKIRNTGITAKRDIRHPCYVATATQNLKYSRNSGLWRCSHIIISSLVGVVPTTPARYEVKPEHTQRLSNVVTASMIMAQR